MQDSKTKQYFVSKNQNKPGGATEKRALGVRGNKTKTPRAQRGSSSSGGTQPSGYTLMKTGGHSSFTAGVNAEHHLGYMLIDDILAMTQMHSPKYPQLGPMASPNIVNNVSNIVQEAKPTSAKDIVNNHTGNGEKTDASGKPFKKLKPIKPKTEVDTIYWIHNGNFTISVAGGKFNGQIYYQGDTMSQIVREKGFRTRVLEENIYPSR